jgi:hypothetical protein
MARHAPTTVYMLIRRGDPPGRPYSVTSYNRFLALWMNACILAASLIPG